MTAFLKRDDSILTMTILTAFITRFMMLVVGRPEFVGWFNHSPYYWVQSKSILEHGTLAFGDMPLLFVLYAGLAKAASLLGVPMEAAIVVTSRLAMTIVPALVPVSVYLLSKNVANGDRLNWQTKCLVFASGFLPLTFAHMPEILQKNMMGMMLLSFVMLAIFRWLQAGGIWRLCVVLLSLVTTCLVHLGSGLATMLLVAALAIDFALRSSSLKVLLRAGLLVTGPAAAIAFGIHLFDPGSTARVVTIMEGLLPTGTGKLLLHVIIIGVWLALLLLLWRWIAKRTANKNNESTATLTRVIALWLGFLAMPLWPGETGFRLMLYIPLGAVVLLILVDSLFPKKTIYRYVAATVTLTFSVMSGAEAVSLVIVYADKTRTSQELAAVADKYGLSQNDLVITPYSAGPIANWFLGTKASLVTAAEYNSATQYDRIFVLNTLERPAPGLEPGECRLIQSDNDRYWATRHDVPLGEDAIPDPDYNKFAFYRLKSLPEDWKFDGEGRWTGWGDCF